MGYLTELNTLLGLPKDFDVSVLQVGSKHTITKDRERAFPLHIALLMVTSDWNFLGYAVCHSMKNEKAAGKSDREVFISLATRYHPDLYQDASPEVKDLAVEYTQALNALKTAGELKP